MRGTRHSHGCAEVLAKSSSDMLLPPCQAITATHREQMPGHTCACPCAPACRRLPPPARSGSCCRPPPPDRLRRTLRLRGHCRWRSNRCRSSIGRPRMRNPSLRPESNNETPNVRILTMIHYPPRCQSGRQQTRRYESFRETEVRKTTA